MRSKSSFMKYVFCKQTLLFGYKGSGCLLNYLIKYLFSLFSIGSALNISYWFVSIELCLFSNQKVAESTYSSLVLFSSNVLRNISSISIPMFIMFFLLLSENDYFLMIRQAYLFCNQSIFLIQSIISQHSHCLGCNLLGKDIKIGGKDSVQQSSKSHKYQQLEYIGNNYASKDILL